MNQDFRATEKMGALCVDGKATKHGKAKFKDGMVDGQLNCTLCKSGYVCMSRSFMEGGSSKCGQFDLNADMIRFLPEMN